MLTLPDLPYDYSALEPHISAETLRLHHDKHHQAYVTAANKLIEGTPLAQRSLEDIIAATAGNAGQRTLFNQAAQAWNHAFYWTSMKPGGGGRPSGEIAAKIAAAFGGYDDFCRQLAAAATGQFGSGWAWLVEDRGQLKIVATSNAETPLAAGQNPLLTVDVWEHAYYVDYRNRRADYVNAFIGHLIDWDFANANLAHAKVPAEAK